VYIACIGICHCACLVLTDMCFIMFAILYCTSCIVILSSMLLTVAPS